MDDKTYADWGETLRKRFPGYESDEFDQAWDEVKQRLVVDQSVTGIVVARAPFGAWIDLGVGFPGLLEIIRMAGLSPERYRAGDWCPIGSQVTAFVSGFKDRGRQIGLSQTA
jgi:hypothetical protein